MKTWWGIAFGILCGLLGAAVIQVASSQPRGSAVQLQPPPTPLPILVHVTGAVTQPGVYALPRNCRVRDAVEAAGGPAMGADTGVLNLAAFLEDGAQLWVPYKTQAGNSPQLDPQIDRRPDSEPVHSATFSSAAPINLNTATQAELESLPGIGPVIAQRIIAYRVESGPFLRSEDVQNVPGIGPAIFEKIKDLISVNGAPGMPD